MNDEMCRNIARRYPMSQGLRYVMGPLAAPRTGAGETVWMSRREVAFLANGPACVGDKVQLFIEWPVLLQNEVPLQLSLNAEIVQRSGPLSIARLTKYEFRTRGFQSALPSARYRLPISGREQPHPARRIPATKTPMAAPGYHAFFAAGR